MKADLDFVIRHFEELEIKKQEELLQNYTHGNVNSERASTSMSKTTLIGQPKSPLNTESNITANENESSHTPRYLEHRRTGSSKYHLNCNGLHEPVTITPSVYMDKKTRDKINTIKRILLHTKMQQEPVELKKYCRYRLAKEKSKIPISRWNPSTIYRHDSLQTKPTKKKEKATPVEKEVEIKPYILNLVPYITPLSANTNSTAQPFRDRFELEYSNAYLEVAKSIPKIKYKPLNLSAE